MKEVIPRDFASAPRALTPAAVHEWLTERGAQEIITTSALAIILGISKRTITDARREGKIKAIDKNTYLLKDCIPWIISRPRFVAQQKPRWEIAEQTPDHIRAIIRKDWRGLLRFRDLDDLVSEVIVRMQRKPKTNANEGSIIYWLLTEIWNEIVRRGENMTVSFSELESRGRSFSAD